MYLVILLTFVVLLAIALAAFYAHLRRESVHGGLWRSTLRIGFAVGVIRAALASVGWYVVEHTGGPFQIPAFALAMMAWPEAAFFLRERRTTPVPPEFYIRLSLLLITTTMLLAGVLAVVARLAHRKRQRRSDVA